MFVTRFIVIKKHQYQFQINQTDAIYQIRLCQDSQLILQKINYLFMYNLKDNEKGEVDNSKNKALRHTHVCLERELDLNKTVNDINSKKCKSPKVHESGLNESWSNQRPNFNFLPPKKWESPPLKINQILPSKRIGNENSGVKGMNQFQFVHHNQRQFQKETKKIFEMIGEQDSPEQKQIDGRPKSYKFFQSKCSLNRTQQQPGHSIHTDLRGYKSPQKQLKIQCIINNIKKRQKNLSVEKESQISTEISSRCDLKNQINNQTTSTKYPLLKKPSKQYEDTHKNFFTKLGKEQSTDKIHFYQPHSKLEHFPQKQSKISILTLSRTPTCLSINMDSDDKDTVKQQNNYNNNKSEQEDHQNQHQFISFLQFSKKYKAPLQRRHSMNHPFQFHKTNLSLKINDFKLGKLIGKGKFGQVHMAMHKTTGFIVAIKCIHKCRIKQYHMQKQLLEEIKLQSFSKHSNIVNLYGIMNDTDFLYLILQYMEGGTLFEALQNQKKIPQHEAVFFLKEIVEAVEYLHRHNIAHRDIKPENIVFNLGIAKLCDFGWSARVFDKRKTYCGTLDYFPPQILQRKQYNEAVDLWCLGILMYEVLIGKVPFEMNQKSSSINRIINVDKEKLYFPTYITKNAKDVISKLLKKKQEERIKASELLHHQFFQQINQ